VIVNGVDTDHLRRAAALIRAAGQPVTVPLTDVSEWLDAVAEAAERAPLGRFIPGLLAAGSVARTRLGEEETP
jgi:hypothetical protein